MKGDRVRVKASVKIPHFEWGAVKHGRYVIIEGSITLYSTAVWSSLVCFPIWLRFTTWSCQNHASLHCTALSAAATLNTCKLVVEISLLSCFTLIYSVGVLTELKNKGAPTRREVEVNFPEDNDWKCFYDELEVAPPEPLLVCYSCLNSPHNLDPQHIT